MLPERAELLSELEEVYDELAALLTSSHLERPVTYHEIRRRLASLEEANARLRRAQEEMVRAERLMAMGEMAAEIGHEINNYLSVLGGRAEIVMRSIARGDLGQAERSARVVADQVDKLRRLTRSLMDFSRQGTEKKLEDPAELVVDTVQLLGITARRAGVALLAGCPGDLPRVYVDRAQVEQLLVNLIKNAIEAVAGRRDGQIIVGAGYERERDEVRFEVRDNGSGIPAEVRERLFEPQVSTKAKGRGFGLAVAYRVARNHNGRLEVDSAGGKGSTFVFAVPVEPAGRVELETVGGGKRAAAREDAVALAVSNQVEKVS